MDLDPLSIWPQLSDPAPDPFSKWSQLSDTDPETDPDPDPDPVDPFGRIVRKTVRKSKAGKLACKEAEI